MGPQVERQRRDNRGAEGCEEEGVGVPVPMGVRSGEGHRSGGGAVPLLYQNSKFSCILGSN